MEFIKRKKGPFNSLGYIRKVQENMAKAYGRPTSAMTTNYEVSGKSVIFIHNPQTGGTSLGEALGVKRRSHATAAERMREKYWLRTFSIAVVREPFSRFVSSYYGTVMPEQPINGLVKMYGPDVKTLTPFQFLDLLKIEPNFGGSQLRYISYPSKVKPYADLILRFEEIETWGEKLEASGLNIRDFRLPHKNSKENKPKNVLDILNINENELAELRLRVRTQFAQDYDALGY